MNEMIKMVVVLTILSSVSGGLLAAIHDGTAAQIENQQLKFVKGPAIKEILEGSANDPIADRFKITDGEFWGGGNESEGNRGGNVKKGGVGRMKWMEWVG